MARVSLVLLLLIVGCSESRKLPPVDVRYSEFLSILGGSYTAISGSEASTTVGVVQVFSGRGRRGSADLAEVTRGELLFESRQRDVIDRLISAIQHHEPIEDPSCDLGKGATWILVAYDSALFRAGVIRLYACGQRDKTVVGVNPVGDAGIKYSREAVAVLRSHRLIGAK
jgi:hypothetical protein